jgi:uncharacterized membrane protein YagU involved in acid resistance
MRRDGGNVVGEALAGAVSGLAASWLMSALMPALERLQPSAAREREKQVQDKSALRVAAEKAAAAAGRDLEGKAKRTAPLAIHYGYGAAWGAAWAVVRRQAGRLGPWAGVAFGATLWAISDETLVPLLRLSPAPWRFPLSTHLRGLVAHLAYGAATDGGVRVAARALG